jgi:hypothetical protein
VTALSKDQCRFMKELDCILQILLLESPFDHSIYVQFSIPPSHDTIKKELIESTRAVWNYLVFILISAEVYGLH